MNCTQLLVSQRTDFENMLISTILWLKNQFTHFGVLDMGEEPDAKKMSNGSKAPGQEIYS